ncbi:MAG TPA: hypothetical protein VFW14_06215 [Gaiellales bacterium]|jgi:hypothetical protein|nr:hypothetical protein [Gaiellales bacterium]
MTAGQLATPHGHRPTRAVVAGLGALLVILAAVAAVHLRHQGPALPFHGPAAARFLEQRGEGNDQVVRARCGQTACTVWLEPIGSGAVPRPQMFRNLAVDAYLIGSMQAPGGAVFAHDWRFVLTTPTAVLTAECTHSQVPRLAGEMTPAKLPHTCRTSWRTT